MREIKEYWINVWVYPKLSRGCDTGHRYGFPTTKPNAVRLTEAYRGAKNKFIAYRIHVKMKEQPTVHQKQFGFKS